MSISDSVFEDGDSDISDLCQPEAKKRSRTPDVQSAAQCDLYSKVVQSPRPNNGARRRRTSADDAVASTSTLHSKRTSRDTISLDAHRASTSSTASGSHVTGARVSSRSSPSYSIAFNSGNPSVEITEGVVHLFRDESYRGSSNMICFLGVPGRMTSHDLIQFLAPVECWIEHIQVVRDSSPNQYMLLVKFRNHQNALDFHKNFHDKPFNSVEQDVCNLAFVSRIETVKAQNGACLPVPG